MNRRITSSMAAAAIAIAFATPATALAHDQQGLGIGANLTLGSSIASTLAMSTAAPAGGIPLSISGLSMNYWMSPDLMLEFMLGVGFAIFDSAGPGSGDSIWSLGGSVGFFGVLADGGQTNLMLGGRLGVVAVINYTGQPEVDDNQAAVHIDVPLRVEHWVDDHFSINGQVGIALVIVPDAPAIPVGGGIGTTSGFFGGAGFTYYLDGPVGGSTVAPPPPAEVRSAPPPAPPPPATGPTTEPDQESGAGW